MPVAPLPDIGRISAKGITSAGIKFVIGERSDTIRSSVPEARSIYAAVSTATSGGNMPDTIFIPSSAPSIKSSYDGSFFIIAVIRTSAIMSGIT